METTPNIPYNQEAEEATIGAVLINPTMFIRVAGVIKESDFYLFRHRLIWQAFTTLKAQGRELDYLTVISHLQEVNALNDIGGPAYLTQLLNSTPDSTYAMAYADIIARLSARRNLIAASGKIKSLAEDGKLTLEEVEDAAVNELRKARRQDSLRALPSWAETVQSYWDEVDKAYTTGATITGLPTGFRDLDRVIGGMHPEELIIAAGRPGMGKSSFAAGIIVNRFQQDPEKRIALFSLEMSREQIAQRLNSMVSQVGLTTVRSAAMSAQEYRRFVDANGKIAKWPLLLADTSRISLETIRSQCQEWAMERGGLSLVVIDYLQLMSVSSGNGQRKMQSEYDEITTLSKGCKELARELGIPVLVLSQLSRAVEQRQNKRPVLSDLRASGSIEQDADKVIFLYRDEVYNENTEFPNQAELIIAKHRNGPTGAVHLYFEKTLTRFMNGTERVLDFTTGELRNAS